jgi:hypothetical protein
MTNAHIDRKFILKRRNGLHPRNTKQSSQLLFETKEANAFNSS